MVGMKRAIIGMAVGNYSAIEHMQCFVKSLRKHYDQDICIIVDIDEPKFIEWFKSYNVDVLKLESKVTPESVMYKRWLLPRTVIQEMYSDYDEILLPDTRDVVFQDHPFSMFTDTDLQLSVETKSIGECTAFNAMWIKTRYGEDTFYLLEENSILCAGITGGKKDAVIRLCDIMEQEHIRLGDRFVDQAALNVLSREPGFPSYTLHYTGDSGIATIGHSLGVCTVEGGVVYGDDGVIPAIVHQYDRHPSIAPSIIERALA